jgi:hypothetical protein
MGTTTRALAALGLAAVGAFAPAAAAQSIGYHLFDPTPRAQLRPLATERPGATDSPLTVDPGHVQVESDVAAWSRAVADDGGAQTTWHLGTTNVRVGLFPRVDVQVIVQPLAVRTAPTPNAGASTVAVGAGDLTVRLKANLLGDRGGRVALALIPFVSRPTATAGLGSPRAEPGLSVPASVALPAGFGLGSMLLLAAVADPAGGYRPTALLTLTASHAIVGALAGFAEVAATGLAPGERPGFEVHGGVLYGVAADVQLDAWFVGAAVGPASGSAQAFLGVSARR